MSYSVRRLSLFLIQHCKISFKFPIGRTPITKISCCTLLQSIKHNQPTKHTLQFLPLTRPHVHSREQLWKAAVHVTHVQSCPQTYCFQLGNRWTVHCSCTNDLTKIWQQSYDQARAHFDPSRPDCQTHANTRTQLVTNKVRKELTVGIKNQGGLFQQVLQKVTRTYQRLRQKAAFLQVPATNLCLLPYMV